MPRQSAQDEATAVLAASFPELSERSRHLLANLMIGANHTISNRDRFRDRLIDLYDQERELPREHVPALRELVRLFRRNKNGRWEEAHYQIMLAEERAFDVDLNPSFDQSPPFGMDNKSDLSFGEFSVPASLAGTAMLSNEQPDQSFEEWSGPPMIANPTTNATTGGPGQFSKELIQEDFRRERPGLFSIAKDSHDHESVHSLELDLSTDDDDILEAMQTLTSVPDQILNYGHSEGHDAASHFSLLPPIEFPPLPMLTHPRPLSEMAQTSIQPGTENASMIRIETSTEKPSFRPILPRNAMTQHLEDAPSSRDNPRLRMRPSSPIAKAAKKPKASYARGDRSIHTCGVCKLVKAKVNKATKVTLPHICPDIIIRNGSVSIKQTERTTQASPDQIDDVPSASDTILTPNALDYVLANFHKISGPNPAGLVIVRIDKDGRETIVEKVEPDDVESSLNEANPSVNHGEDDDGDEDGSTKTDEKPKRQKRKPNMVDHMPNEEGEEEDEEDHGKFDGITKHVV
jgi:hypothetical protein